MGRPAVSVALDGVTSTGLLGEAVESEDRAYRYVLNRRWGQSGPVLCMIMLNPSLADAKTDDPTITRCVTRAMKLSWRGRPYSGLCVLNLFALRSPSPKILRGHPDPVGEENGKWLTGAVAGTDHIMVAWGAHGGLHGRSAAVLELLAAVPLLCLGTCANGEPKHPLYVGYDVPLRPYP
jgi:hypothetical protein